MSNADRNYHQFFRLANDPDTDVNQLDEIVALNDELLSAAVALNPKCTKEISEKMIKIKSLEVSKNIEKRFKNYPALYSLNVREINEGDAEYIYGLRTDERYSRYLSNVSEGVDAQTRYIKQYLTDSKVERTSCYFILENKQTGLRCGTVRVYNFDGDTFEWGSWILDENRSRYAAMDTVILVYEYGFNVLGFAKSEFEVNKNNVKVISYHQKSGAELIGEDETNFYFRVKKETGLKFSKTLRDRLEAKLQ